MAITPFENILRCPKCSGRVKNAETEVACVNQSCAAVHPVVAGAPVMINEENSVFRIEEIKAEGEAFSEARGRPKQKVRRKIPFDIPSFSLNIAADENFKYLAGRLLESGAKPRVLILGGRSLGNGVSELVRHGAAMDILETDIGFGDRTRMIVDAHDIPFEDNVFDCVIAQAMLEHVADPARCVSEIWRVLRKDGIVYAETPFMQQVHMGAYDFTRFTYVGHRRLFRNFSEIKSGVVCGPGMALASAYRHFMLNLFWWVSKRQRLDALISLSCFWLKYFDRMFASRREALDAAAGYYFMGEKSGETIADRDLVTGYYQ